jgi:hypothetical protein
LTITREIREKVIQMYIEGRGRNEIARLLTGQGPEWRISEGSVGNIIRAYREQSLQEGGTTINAYIEKHDQPLQENASVMVEQPRSSSNVLEQEPDLKNFEENRYPVDVGHGAPLDWFLSNGFSEGAVKAPDEKPVDNSLRTPYTSIDIGLSPTSTAPRYSGVGRKEPLLYKPLLILIRQLNLI